MAVIRKPFSAAVRFTNAAEERVQSLNKLKPTLTATEINGLFQAVNAIRKSDAGYPVTGGRYTVTEELSM